MENHDNRNIHLRENPSPYEEGRAMFSNNQQSSETTPFYTPFMTENHPMNSDQFNGTFSPSLQSSDTGTVRLTSNPNLDSNRASNMLGETIFLSTFNHSLSSMNERRQAQSQQEEPETSSIEIRQDFEFQFSSNNHFANNHNIEPININDAHDREFRMPSFKKLENRPEDSGYIQLLSSTQGSGFDSINQIFLPNAFEGLINPFQILNFFKAKVQFSQNLPKSGICGRMINQGEIAYQCHTCEMDNLCFICSHCFENGNHSGHNFEILRNPERVLCDCGDHEAWRQTGFCRNHKGFIKNTGFDIFNESEKNRFKKNFAKAIYYLSEAFDQSSSRSINSNYYSFSIIQILEVLRNIVNNHKFMCFLITDALTSKIKDFFGNVKMHKNHDCQGHKKFDFKEEQNTMILTPENQTCQCTVLELLFRINPKLDQRAQMALNSFFTFLFNSQEFKEKFIFTYLKNFKYTFSFEIMKKNINSHDQLTEMFKLAVQLFACENLTEKALKNEEWMYFLDTLIEVITIYEKNYRKQGPRNSFLNKIFNHEILHSLRWLIFKRKVVKGVFENKIALEKIFKIFEIFYRNRYEVNTGYQRNIDILENAQFVMGFEITINSFFNEVFGCLASGYYSVGEGPFLYFMRAAQAFIIQREKFFEEKKKFYESKNIKLMRSPCLPIERIYISGILSYMFFNRNE